MILTIGVVAAGLTTPLTVLAADTYGAGVSLKEAVPLTRVIEKPSDFEGKTVRVEGVVTAVCSHMGCWMALAPAQADAPDAPSAARTMMIKVDDGVIVFPVSAKGRRAVAQGVVERVGGDVESREAADEHAKHTGAKADQATNWQIKATGAVVY
jgi:hypothetical protein